MSNAGGHVLSCRSRALRCYRVAVKLIPTTLRGAYTLKIDPIEDDRGFFARSWSDDVISNMGLDCRIAQCSISFNRHMKTVRGLHFQQPPFAETKIVRCTAGAIFDVILDVRPDSSTFLKWYGQELNCDNRDALYIPVGFAHGFQTLTDNAEVFYMISTQFNPGAARTIRWDDAALGITWPHRRDIVISHKDATAASAAETLGIDQS